MRKLAVVMVMCVLSVNMAFGDCMSVLDDIKKEKQERTINKYSKLPIFEDTQTLANFILEREDIAKTYGILLALCGIASGDDFSSLIRQMKEGNSVKVRNMFNYFIDLFDKERNKNE